MKYSPAVIMSSALLSVVLSGCTMGRVYEIGPETQFIYPNSNVKALGPVSVKRTGNFSFLQPSLRTGKEDLKLYNMAVSTVADANVVIDYYLVTDLKYLYPIPFFWTESRIEGTAAKATVGQQELR